MKTPREKIGIQEALRLVKMTVISNREYKEAMDRLEQMDQILRQSHLESQAIDLHWERCCKEATEGVHKAQKKALIESKLWRRQALMAREAVSALRVNILRHELGVPSMRELSVLISGNEVYAHFCGMLEGNEVRGSSKSRLDRLSRVLSEEQLKELHGSFLSVIGSAEHCEDVGLNGPVGMETSLVDGTCIEANIHHPTDWRLLGDVARTLLLGLDQIRQRGLLNRMPEWPSELRSQFNKLGIEMTHTRRRKDGRKARKGVFRRMKRLLKSVGEHARRHLILLDKDWEKAGFCPGEYRILKARMERMLERFAESDPSGA